MDIFKKHEKIKDNLLKSGWRLQSNPDSNLDRQSNCKTDYLSHRFDCTQPCSLNRKQGIPVSLTLVSFHTADNPSFELSVRGQLIDGSWVCFKNYALPKHVDQCLSKIQRLVDVWDFMASMES